jgi:hypothetical protein
VRRIVYRALFDSRRRFWSYVGAFALGLVLLAAHDHRLHRSPPAVPTTVGVAVSSPSDTTAPVSAATATLTTPTVAPTTTTVAPSTTTILRPPAEPPLPPGAVVAAVSFVRAWSDRSAPSAVWHRAVDRWATAALVSELAATVPANVPRLTITGPPAGSGSAVGAEVTVPTTAGPVDLILTNDGGWKVDVVE